MNIDLKKAKTQYLYQRATAKYRKVDFQITFEEWFKVWIDSGHYHERGVGKDKYCMSRFNDEGPYAYNNVFIQTNAANGKDQKGKSKPVPWCIGKKLTEEHKANQRLAHQNNGFDYGYWKNKTRSEESKIKTSLALKAKPWSEARRKAELLRKEKKNAESL